MKIGVFDSGIGGLTVLKNIIEKYPNNEYIYFGDTLNNPYGNKTKEELIDLSIKIIDFLISKKVDLIVIACGTISSNVYDILKNKYSIPLIDIITPTINYLNNSNYSNIGVIATNATINSKIFTNNVKKNIKEIACPEFVSLIEKNNFKTLDKYLKLYLDRLRDRDIIVLGCTHYPIIKDKISEYLNNDIKLLDMGDCLSININDNIKQEIILYFSKLDKSVIDNINTIVGSEKISIKEKKL